VRKLFTLTTNYLTFKNIIVMSSFGDGLGEGCGKGIGCVIGVIIAIIVLITIFT
jgi:hypothetical protein